MHDEWCNCYKCERFGGANVIKGSAIEKPPPDQLKDEEVMMGKDLVRAERKTETKGQHTVTWRGMDGIPLEQLEDFCHEARALGKGSDDLVKYDKQVRTGKMVGDTGRREQYVEHMFFVEIETTPVYETAKPLVKRRPKIRFKTAAKAAAYPVGGIALVGVAAGLWNTLELFLGWFT